MTYEKAFEFKEFKPCLDWYETINHVINYNDYEYFKLDRRYGPSWWLYGKKLIEEPTYHWVEIEIGQISESDLPRFINWAKTEYGSRIIDIHMLSGSFDIFEEIVKLISLNKPRNCPLCGEKLQRYEDF